MQASTFSPANYLATFLVEEFGYPYPDQQHIDFIEKNITMIAKQHAISLDEIPSHQEIEALFSKVHAYIDLDEVFSA